MICLNLGRESVTFTWFLFFVCFYFYPNFVFLLSISSFGDMNMISNRVARVTQYFSVVNQSRNQSYSPSFPHPSILLPFTRVSLTDPKTTSTVWRQFSLYWTQATYLMWAILCDKTGEILIPPDYMQGTGMIQCKLMEKGGFINNITGRYR